MADEDILVRAREFVEASWDFPANWMIEELIEEIAKARDFGASEMREDAANYLDGRMDYGCAYVNAITRLPLPSEK